MSWVFLVIIFAGFSCIIECGRISSKLPQKPKTIGEFGEFECVDIYKQPAFDNILLKNHKIQMNPSFLPKFKRDEKLSFNRYRKIRSQTKDSCPEGMVPIQNRRVKNDADLKSISKMHLGNIHPFTSTEPGKHFAVFQNRLNKPGHYGARALMELYNPPVEMNQISMAQIWLEGGPETEITSLQFGWAVHPRLYGDNLTRATAYWTPDGYRTGCYNTMCPGFVQVHPSFGVGKTYDHLSTVGGDIFGTQPMIYKDPETGNWWLFFDTSDKIGYWPKEIVPQLDKGASFVQFGGWTYNSPDGLSPPMGTGRFPNKKFEECSFFAQIQTVNKFNKLIDIERDSMQKVVDNASCYDAIHWGNLYGVYAQTFSYGGPGGMCGI